MSIHDNVQLEKLAFSLPAHSAATDEAINSILSKPVDINNDIVCQECTNKVIDYTAFPLKFGPQIKHEPKVHFF